MSRVPKTGKGTYQGSPCKRGHDGTRYVSGGGCVECCKTLSRTRWAADPLKWREAKRATYDPSIRRDYQLRKCYGITLAQYRDRLAEQGGVCAICNTPEVTAPNVFHVDHNHVTGAVRKLLCQKCNVAIGLLDDDPERMEKAAAYIREHS